MLNITFCIAVNITLFSVFEKPMRHFLSSLIFYINVSQVRRTPCLKLLVSFADSILSKSLYNESTLVSCRPCMYSHISMEFERYKLIYRIL